MEIVFISNKAYPEFEIYEENKMVIHIKIDLQTQAFRVMSQDTKRVFFIAEELVKKKNIITLLNEYGQQLGTLHKSELNDNDGEIEIEDDQYTYKLHDDFLKEINLFDRKNYKSILSCKLETGQLSSLNKDYISYLLFALVWFKFLTRQQPAFVQLAEA